MVRIVGQDPNGVALAQELLNYSVSISNANYLISNTFSTPQIEEMDIRKDQVGWLLGRGGENVNRICRESGCLRILVVNNDSKIQLLGNQVLTLFHPFQPLDNNLL